ncbi:nuclear transport factor 2 family protein [Catalinimonas niigatensis]|uniref:hypothetical protein n=1 Tax=Catalinimonas niigatensis TaxID=1397264 RepID=UPI0026659290|nr:hypothetical protein [Catalinimonas niigatensis]WPP49768.1 hypothetical protein PZB72_24150 [Catalinimonas niigatensis]
MNPSNFNNSRTTILLISCVGLLLSCTNKSQSTEDQEDLLWKLEEEYIEAHKEADHSSILSMWDENFLGWPSRLESSMRKNSGSEYLEKQEIYIEDNIALLHYRLFLFERSTRLTHTWIKRKDKWYILGGMDWNE